MKLLGLTLVMGLGVMGLTACGGGDKPANPDKPTQDVVEDKVEVTFYDGDKVLKTEKVKKGEKLASYTPTKDGYVFSGWYATPNFVHRFDFDEPVTKPTRVFALFRHRDQKVDTRTFYVVGSGTSKLLRKSNWGKVFCDEMKMTKAQDKNEYKLTLDLNKDDQFQFALNDKWHNQKGYGYLATNKLPDGTEAFQSASTIGDNSSLRINIKVVKPGNYTFTLNTFPDDDTYETKNPSYTEENKEAFNINYNDKITFVRNGDVLEDEVETVVEYFIKGEGITNWQNMYNNSTKFQEKDSKATLSVYLKKNETFMIATRFTVGQEKPTEGNIYVKGDALDDASKELFTVQPQSNNIITKEAGMYTFTIDLKTNKLSATLDKEAAPVAADYYIDGTFGEGNWDGYCFNEKYKLVEEKPGKFTIKNVAMKKDSELIIQAFKEGSTERGEWGKPSYNGLGSYNFTYLAGSAEEFEAVGGGNNNIKVLVAGSYDITFDEYSKIIAISKHVEGKDTLDIYIKGSGINNWNHNFDSKYLMKLNEEETAYEFTLTVTDPVEFGLEVFNKGVTEGYGTFVNSKALGTEGDANDLFKTEGNFKCTTAGAYRVVYNITTQKVDFYKAK